LNVKASQITPVRVSPRVILGKYMLTNSAGGGANAFSVLLTGLQANVPTYGGSGSDSSSGSSDSTSITTSPPSTETQAKQRPTVVTSMAQGTTVIITQTPEATSGSSSGDSSSGGGTSVAGIAAGVVVGVLAVIAIVVGIFFLLRRRKKQAAEEEYKRTQVSDFMRGGERKPPSTGYSQMSDSRLDPESGARRDSHGSIADNQDYSRRVLRVSEETLLNP
jgi:cell wall integrity and stress response component